MNYDTWISTDPADVRGYRESGCPTTSHRDALEATAEILADRLLVQPCSTGCGNVCGDREPPRIAGAPVCPECYERAANGGDE